MHRVAWWSSLPTSTEAKRAGFWLMPTDSQLSQQHGTGERKASSFVEGNEMMNQHGMVSAYVYIINSAGFGGSEKFNETARLRVVAAPRVTGVGRVGLKGAFWICKKVQSAMCMPN
ncbi:hypothetical protein BHE74_00011682 [Ensete ventricosum]|nr:hypothetical protein BHE74_00011682 [Ensete ventricosum]